jgi:hypothetical protein
VALISLFLGLFWLLESPLVLASAGGRVEWYLWSAAIAVPALGWGRAPYLRIAAALVILVSLYLANTDHVAGVVLQERVLKIKYTHSTAATQATDKNSGKSPIPSEGK